MVVIGVTGSVGTGKSTVAKLFKRLGAAVIDTDHLARAVVEPGTPGWREIKRAFGKGVLRKDGAIDRSALAQRVFSDEAARKRLERIIHPRVIREVKKELRRLRKHGKTQAAVVEVPLLFESGMDQLMDSVVVVRARRSVQLDRLRRKHGWSKKEVDARIKAQWDLSAKVALADQVIDNDGSVAVTRKQVRTVWNKLARPNRPRRNSRSSRS